MKLNLLFCKVYLVVKLSHITVFFLKCVLPCIAWLIIHFSLFVCHIILVKIVLMLVGSWLYHMIKSLIVFILRARIGKLSGISSDGPRLLQIFIERTWIGTLVERRFICLIAVWLDIWCRELVVIIFWSIGIELVEVAVRVRHVIE